MITLRQRWQPAFYLTCIMLGCVTLLCSLGYWQLSREQAKLALLEQWKASVSQPPLSADALFAASPLALRFRAIKFEGIFLNERTILLDNKINNGQVGYHVLVPMVLPNNHLILINRGWIPLGKNRTLLPTIHPVTGKVGIEGTLDFAYRNPLISSPIESTTIHWPLRVQTCDIAFLAEILARPIYPLVVNLKADSSLAFETFQLPKEWLSPERHRGYAIQWFACALMLIFLYSFYFWRHIRKKIGRQNDLYPSC